MEPQERILQAVSRDVILEFYQRDLVAQIGEVNALLTADHTAADDNHILSQLCVLGQVRAKHDMVAVNTGNGELDGQCAHGGDQHIGLYLCHHAGVHLGV